MTTMAGPRKTVSIYDYPEHLNPFREEDNHNKIRFWTIGRKLSRSNSITFSGIKDLRNSWSLRSFMKKGKKGEQTSSQSNKTNQVNGETSPILYRRALQYSSGSGARSTVGSPERADRYVYGGSVTPLPRSRFQERLRSSQQEVNSPSATPRMARSDITGSRLSVESTNPFDEEAPIPPIRASRRKKKRAPPPPATAADDSVTSENLELRITEADDSKSLNVTADDDIDEMNLKIELKIVEDEDNNNLEMKPSPDPSQDDKGGEGLQILATDHEEAKDIENKSENQTNNVEEIEQRSESVKDLASEEAFPKIDIVKYRRNSSVDEDDIRLRRGNLEDFHSLSNKRSKSLTNTADNTYIAYDINLNQNKIDINSNEEEPQKVVCKVYDESRKQSIANSISSTEKEFLEIDKATRELEREISKLNTALNEDDLSLDNSRLSVSEIRQKLDRNGANSPNPIPKPRRSHYGESSSPANGNLQV